MSYSLKWVTGTKVCECFIGHLDIITSNTFTHWIATGIHKYIHIRTALGSVGCKGFKLENKKCVVFVCCVLGNQWLQNICRDTICVLHVCNIFELSMTIFGFLLHPLLFTGRLPRSKISTSATRTGRFPPIIPTSQSCSWTP